VAQYNLGVLLAEGSGVARDVGAARQWFEKAAAYGYPLAVRNLEILDAA
jgi:uncharacterized protein